MSESIQEKKNKIEKDEEDPKKRVVIPEFCGYSNDDGTDYIAEVILPGVEKDTIKLNAYGWHIYIECVKDEM